MNGAVIEPKQVFNKFYYIGGSLVTLALLFALSQYNFLLFHGIAELFSIVVAWSLFIMVWNTRRIVQNDALLFLGIAYLFMGLIDLIHTLSYEGMGIFPNLLGSNYSTQLWIAARGMEAISLLLFPMFITRRIRSRLVIEIYAVITAFLMATIFSWHSFPDCFINGQGLTFFKKVAEYIIILTLIGSIVLLYRTRHQLDTPVFRLMVGAIAIAIVGELAFTFYVSVLGLSNTIGHFFKIISFSLIYLALIHSSLTKLYTTLFRDLEKEKAALKESEFFFKESQHAATIGSYKAEFYPNDIWRTSDVCDEIFGINNTYEKTVKGWAELLHPDGAAEMIRYVTDDVIGRGIPFNKEYKIVHHSDGEIRWVLGLGETIKDETGRTTGLIGTIQDITERKKSEKALQESEDKFRALFELSPIGMAMIDHETGKFLEVNNAVLQPIGYTKEEFIALSFWEITPPEYEKQEADQIAQLNKTGRFGPNEKEYIRKDGSRYPIRIRGFLMTNSSGRKVVWGIIEDLTEIKLIEEEKAKLQQQLNHKSKMDAIGELAGGMAHDFNNVLSGIIGASQLLQLPKHGLNEKSLKYVGMIIQASIRASDLINKLLTFSRKGQITTTT
ncbi:MAG: PAS domain S-box protein, partial [Spirochaetaceae bacterium]|nr:PAS domain S-box protein [Spirochaetaceae bacterium]